MIKTTLLIVIFGFLAACGNKQEDNANRAAQYLKSAELLAQQGQLRAALVQAKNVIQNTPDSAQGYLQIARIYNQIGYYSEVEKLLGNKLSLMPELSYELAYAFYQRKKYRTALDTLAVSGVEQNQSYRLLKSLCHLHLDEVTEFDMELRKTNAFSAEDGFSSFAQASFAQANNDGLGAEKYFAKVDSSSELYVDALIGLAEVYIQRAQLDAAEKKLTEALSLMVNADTLTVEKAKILSMLVQMLVQQGRSGEAYKYQKILASANPQLDSMKSRFDEAVAFYAKGEVESAKIHLTELHKSFPNNSNVTTLLGVIAFQQGQDEEAEAYLSQVIDPETATPGLIQASSLLKTRNNKIDEAIALLKASVNAQPKNAQLLATYGLALLQKNPTDKDGAMALEKSVAMDPKQQRLRLALAERHYRLKEKEQGLAQLETAFRNAPLDNIIQQTYFYQLAKDIDKKQVAKEIEGLKKQYPNERQVALIEIWWMVEQKQYADAEKKLLAVFAGASPKDKMSAYGLLVDLYLKQDKKDSAQKAMEDYLRLAPHATSLYGAWVSLLSNAPLNAVKSNQAIKFLQELQQVDEGAWQPYFYQAVLKAKSQQWDQLDQLLDLVLQKTSQLDVKQQTINLYNTYGFQLYQAGDFRQAQNVFIKTLGVDPDDKTALYYYVQIALNSDQLAQAKKILEPVGTEEPLAIHLFLAGLINEKEQKFDDALNDYRAAWEKEAFELYAEKIYSIYQKKSDKKLLMDFVGNWHQRLPASPQALLLVAMSQQEQNQLESAVLSYEELLKIQPENVIALNNLSWLYAETNASRAEALAASANQLAPNSADVLDTYGWALIKNKKYQEAETVLTKAAALAPDNQTIRLHLQQAQEGLGQ